MGMFQAPYQGPMFAFLPGARLTLCPGVILSMMIFGDFVRDHWRKDFYWERWDKKKPLASLTYKSVTLNFCRVIEIYYRQPIQNFSVFMTARAKLTMRVWVGFWRIGNRKLREVQIPTKHAAETRGGRLSVSSLLASSTCLAPPSFSVLSSLPTTPLPFERVLLRLSQRHKAKKLLAIPSLGDTSRQEYKIPSAPNTARS